MGAAAGRTVLGGRGGTGRRACRTCISSVSLTLWHSLTADKQPAGRPARSIASYKGSSWSLAQAAPTNDRSQTQIAEFEEDVPAAKRAAAPVVAQARAGAKFSLRPATSGLPLVRPARGLCLWW